MFASLFKKTKQTKTKIQIIAKCISSRVVKISRFIDNHIFIFFHYHDVEKELDNKM